MILIVIGADFVIGQGSVAKNTCLLGTIGNICAMHLGHCFAQFQVSFFRAQLVDSVSARRAAATGEKNIRPKICGFGQTSENIIIRNEGQVIWNLA